MNEKVGNLEVFIRKEASSYGPNNVNVKLISLNRLIRNYEMESADTINPHHSVKFENIPLGHYKIEAFCKGYLNKNEFVHVKFSGADTHWKGHSRKSRNRKYLNINKKSHTKVTYSSTLPASEQIVSPYAISIIQLALQKADMPQAVITSTIRTPKEQACIMYNNAKKNLIKQFKLYGSTGDEVLKVYKANQNRPESEVIKLMEDKIATLLKQGRKTSKHVVTADQYKNLNIIDIGVNATRKVCGIAFSIEKFTKALKDLQTNGYIDKLIDETKKSNTCWHIEIKPNAKPLIN